MATPAGMLAGLAQPFGEVTLLDPLAALLLLGGVVLLGVTFGIAGWLVLGAVVEFAGVVGRVLTRSTGRAR